MVSRGGLKFFPGAKLEAKDFSEKWYNKISMIKLMKKKKILHHFITSLLPVTVNFFIVNIDPLKNTVDSYCRIN